MSKIKDKQLEKLQGLIKELNQIQSQVGSIELQKHSLLHQSSDLQNGLNEFQKELEEEYGKVSINVTDGTYEEITEEDEANKKD
jgi:adenine C2-methylase RlmN of 23S rRNA A2503 and tRNA A37